MHTTGVSDDDRPTCPPTTRPGKQSAVSSYALHCWVQCILLLNRVQSYSRGRNCTPQMAGSHQSTLMGKIGRQQCWCHTNSTANRPPTNRSNGRNLTNQIGTLMTIHYYYAKQAVFMNARAQNLFSSTMHAFSSWHSKGYFRGWLLGLTTARVQTIISIVTKTEKGHMDQVWHGQQPTNKHTSNTHSNNQYPLLADNLSRSLWLQRPLPWTK